MENVVAVVRQLFDTSGLTVTRQNHPHMLEMKVLLDSQEHNRVVRCSSTIPTGTVY